MDYDNEMELIQQHSKAKWEDYQPTKDDVERIVTACMDTALKSYVMIGYYLTLAKKLGYDKEYAGIGEYALNKFGISKDRSAKYMKAAEKFCRPGAPVLKDEYKDYSKSQLLEMAYLDDVQAEKVSSNMTIRQIRELKPRRESISDASDVIKDEPVATSQLQPIDDLDLSVGTFNALKKSGIDTINELKNMSNDELVRIHNLGRKGLTEIKEKVIALADKDEFTEEECFREFYRQYVFQRASFDAAKDGDVQTVRELLIRDCKHSGSAGPSQPSMQCYPDKVVFENNKYQIKWGRLAKEMCRIAEEEVKKFFTTERVECEVVNEPISEEYEVDDSDCRNLVTKDIEDYNVDDVLNMLNTEAGCLSVLRKTNEQCSGRRSIRIKTDAYSLLVQKMRQTLETKQIAEADMIQPEFPALTNNDRRRDWVERHVDWPIWIDIPELQTRYRRFVIDKGISLVVKEVLKRTYVNYKLTNKVEWCMSDSYLVGVDISFSISPTMKRCNDNRGFVEFCVNVGTIVEFLKLYQRGDIDG